MIRKVIVIGTGNLAFLCAREAKNKDMVCEVLEYGANSYSLLSGLCRKERLEYLNPGKDQLTKRLLREDAPALLVSANSTYIVPKEIVAKKNLTMINFHPALLPRHPGRNAEAWAIYEQDRTTGVTWHFIDEEIDHGAIINQEKIDLTEKTTSLWLMRQQFAVGARCFNKIFPELLAQNSGWEADYTAMENKRFRRHLAKEVPNQGELDARWELEKMSSFLRAMDYGKLEILGKPFCVIGKTKFVWDRYSIEPNHSKCKTDEARGVFADDTRVIRLLNFRRREDEGRFI